MDPTDLDLAYVPHELDAVGKSQAVGLINPSWLDTFFVSEFRKFLVAPLGSQLKVQFEQNL